MKESFSPLLQVISDEKINSILEEIRSSVRSQVPLTISKEKVSYIKEHFSLAMIRGEKFLHHFSLDLLKLFCSDVVCNLCLNVFGRCSDQSHPKLLKQEIWFDDRERESILLTRSDSLLANTYAPWCIECNQRTKSIASSTDYFPLSAQHNKLVFLRTRIKSTSNIAYKIADIALDIDLTFKRDKVYNSYSQQIKDIYGIKCVVETDADLLSARNIIASMPNTNITEEKNYTGANRKQSGFEAYKLVMESQKQTIEIQIQSNRMHDEERLNWNTSHKTYKEKQMQQRLSLGKEYIKLYETLIQLLSAPREYEAIGKLELAHSQKGQDDDF